MFICIENSYNNLQILILSCANLTLREVKGPSFTSSDPWRHPNSWVEERLVEALETRCPPRLTIVVRAVWGKGHGRGGKRKEESVDAQNQSSAPQSRLQRKKLVFFWGSDIFTPWLLPCGALPSCNKTTQSSVFMAFNPLKWLKKRRFDNKVHFLTSLESIFVLMSLASVKNACSSTQTYKNTRQFFGFHWILDFWSSWEVGLLTFSTLMLDFALVSINLIPYSNASYETRENTKLTLYLPPESFSIHYIP